MKTRTICTLLLALCFIPVIAQKSDSIEIIPEYPYDLVGGEGRGVYGSDDRVDVTEVEGYEKLVEATLVMIPKWRVQGNRIKTSSLRDNLIQRFGVSRFDPNVKFLDQPTAGVCTGFLIAPDIMVTAGHCVTEVTNNCENYVWIFDYTNELNMNSSKEYITIDPDNVFSCDEIMDFTFNQSPWHDYAFIRLDRKSSRAPYQFRVSKEVKWLQDVFMIGAPTGLPLKLADNAYVTSTSNHYTFSTKIDGFPGNSGGPVFDDNGWIEGIMVAGTDMIISDDETSGDYFYDAACNCIKTVTFSSYGSENEFVQRITLTNYDLLIEAIYDNLEYAIKNKDNERLDEWMAYTGMMDHPYTQDRGRLEFLAVEEGNLYALKAYLQRSSNVNVKDEMGRSLLYRAIKRNDMDMVKLLIENGLNPNGADQFDEVPLYWAIQFHNTAMVELLLKSGAQTSINNTFYGQTPLHVAVEMDDRYLAGILIDYGADINAENNRGWTTVKYARKLRHRKLKRYLKKRRRDQ